MSDPRQLHTLTIHNPHYGPQGRPFTLRAIGPAGDVEESYWTEADALDRRDQLLDAGYLHVRILGLPTRAAGG